MTNAKIEELSGTFFRAKGSPKKLEAACRDTINLAESLTAKLGERDAEIKLLLSCNEELRDLLTSARAIAERKGVDTAWKRWSQRLGDAGIGSVTAKVFKILPSDMETDHTMTEEELSEIEKYKSTLWANNLLSPSADRLICKLITEVRQAIASREELVELLTSRQ